jgi:hypothetical protein
MTTLALVLCAAAVIIIGLGVSLAAFPAGEVSVATRIASVFGLGCSAVICLGTVLVLVGAFEPISLAVLLTVITVPAYVVAFRRAGPRAHVNALREEFAADRVFLLLGVGALVLVAVSWLAVPELSLHGGWRYWSDGLELADRGGVPKSTAQWGAAQPPETSKLGGSAFLGALSFVFREQPFAGMSLALWLSAVGYAAGLFALGRELGLKWLAPALALLGITGSSFPGGIVLNKAIGWRFTFFQNEDLSCMLAVVAAAIILASSSERSSLERAIVGAILGGIVFAAAAFAHLIPVIVFGAFTAGVLLARAVVGPQRRQMALAGGALVLAGVVTFASLGIGRGEVGWQQAGSRYTLFEGKYDPTAKVKGLERRPRPKSESRWYKPPAAITRLAAEAAVGRDLTQTTAVILVCLAVAGTAGTLAFGSIGVRLLVVGASAMVVAIVGTALLFSYRYSFHIPGTFGSRRLFPYMAIPLTLLGLALLQVVAARIALRWAVVGRLIAIASVLAVALGTAGGLGAAGKPDSPSYLRAATLTPCDSRLLVDRATRGTFQALTGRISITEGLLPFLRPTILNDVLRLNEATDRFFAAPEGSARILSEQEVDFVIAEMNPALSATGELELVSTTVDGLAVYAVERAPSSRDLPRPTGSAGYHCFTEVPG